MKSRNILQSSAHDTDVTLVILVILKYYLIDFDFNIKPLTNPMLLKRGSIPPSLPATSFLNTSGSVVASNRMALPTVAFAGGVLIRFWSK